MSEMNKLRNALDNAGIAWHKNSFVSPFGWTGIIRTKFINNAGIEVSVICGDNTYGGEIGLLETMPPVHPHAITDSVEGWLTAQDIIDAWL